MGVLYTETTILSCCPKAAYDGFPNLRTLVLHNYHSMFCCFGYSLFKFSTSVTTIFSSNRNHYQSILICMRASTSLHSLQGSVSSVATAATAPLTTVPIKEQIPIWLGLRRPKVKVLQLTMQPTMLGLRLGETGPWLHLRMRPSALTPPRCAVAAHLLTSCLCPRCTLL